MGFAYDVLLSTSSGKKAFIFLYCLANFFQNFGPNTTTFIVPGECFPTRYRSTSHGISWVDLLLFSLLARERILINDWFWSFSFSAASGKLGAIVAQVGFSRLKDIGGTNKFVKHILEIFALFMLTGIFSTYLVPETKGRSLEDISNEDQDGFVKPSVPQPAYSAPV
jgi:PHS family inorganic phosphate transporter-like MFS transporter